MAATYKWSLGFVSAKKAFTDKNGIERTNVIKSVQLIFEGVEGKRKESKDTIVYFELIDLSSFQDYTELSKEIVLTWALEKLDDRDKVEIENFVKSLFGDYNPEFNLINIELND